MRTVQAILLVSMLAVLALVWGCARPTRKPVFPFYEAPLSDLRDVDASCLKGRRIVVDPGHGGVFTGARGPAGLEEDDVNLGVALYLWGLLRDAGADVLLTRSSDRDFVSGSAANLREDLSRRVEFASSFRPDLFVSVHHNADLSMSPIKNQVETYFKMLDEGPSRDVAALVHRYLQERLGIAGGEAVAGNYFVLRNASCPALLGEPSYITNPWVEDKLVLAEKQLLEAQAYFLGIVEYFSRGVPTIVWLAPRDTVLSESMPDLRAGVRDDGPGLDLSSVVCSVDGDTIPASLDASGRELLARPVAPLRSGEHEFCFSFRNLSGNSSGKVCASFEVDLEPAAISLEAFPPVLPESGGVLLVVRLVDENGNPVESGAPVRLSSRTGVFLTESLGTSAGVASSIFFPERPGKSARLFAGTGCLVDSLDLLPSGLKTRCLRVKDESTGLPLEGVGLYADDSLTSKTTAQGLAVLVNSVGRLIAIREGYVPLAALEEKEESAQRESPARVEELEMRRVALGVLKDVRIALDAESSLVVAPETFGRDPGHTLRKPGTAEKMASTQWNAEAARALALLLRGAGAKVLLLDTSLPDVEKVRRAELFGASLYARFQGSVENVPSILHYPGSVGGTRAANLFSRWWKKVVGTRLNVGEDAHYVLRQTSGTAVMFTAPVGSSDDFQVDPRSGAYAGYLAICENLGLDADALPEFIMRAEDVTSQGKAYMELDGFIALPFSRDGSVIFFCEGGQHMVRVVTEKQRSTPQFVLIQTGEGITRIRLR
jgi:N-acetylmuramoyl-L-alanine amidase